MYKKILLILYFILSSDFLIADDHAVELQVMGLLPNLTIFQ